ncbi:MAG TPA: CoA ester lyase, partial [Chloroflexota bacterium]|nr:CoA ester lyase [Chloroflexota bacterium]
MPLRSMLFTPGDQPRKVEKALADLPADAVILDLEDAVAIDRKPQTRAPVAYAVTQPRARPDAPRVFVRANALTTPWFFGDLNAIVAAGLDGVILPKTAGPEEVFAADAYLTHLERERGLPEKSVELLPLIESASGAASLRRLCRVAQRTARVRRLGFGATDFTNDIGATWTDDESQLLLVCSQLVLYSREAGLDPPIDTVYPHFRDRDGYEARCRRSRALGFGGRMCIHPDQIEPTNRLYAPTEEEVEWATEVIAAFEEAEKEGTAALTVRGQLVDYAFVVRARNILEQAGGAGAERAQR